MKTEQAVQGLQALAFCVLNVNSTVVFKHIEDLNDLIILNISVQFQTPLEFYRTVEKIETCDGNGEKFWQVPPSFQPSHFGCYFVFSWLRFKHIEYKGTLT